MKHTIMMTQLFLMLFLKLLILHHGVVKVRAFPQNMHDMNEETKGLSFEYSNSMDEEDFETTTTTLASFNSEGFPMHDANSPNMFIPLATTATTTLETILHTILTPVTTSPSTPHAHATTEESSFDHELISRTSSPVLMKLIAPIESAAAEPLINTTTETNEKTKKSNKNQMKQAQGAVDQQQHQNEEMPTAVNSSKKPRLLNSKKLNPFKSDADADTDLMEDTTTTVDLDSENNETNIDIGEEITTIMPPPSASSTSKRPPKNIEIFKTRPNELLRFYVEDSHLRSPIAALVDKKSNPLGKAKKLWRAALRPNSLLDIMVVSYDSEGIKSTYNLTNTNAMRQTLEKVRDENATDQESKTYYSIIRTGQLIPFDSAIFISTDELPNDTEHQLQASMFLLKKRIRLYLIMFDDKNLSTNDSTANASAVNAATTTTTTTTSISSPTHAVEKETGFLGQLALLTGGDIIYVPNNVFQKDNDGEMGYITKIRRNKLKAIDQDPVKDFHENELRNDTETLSAKDDQDSV